MKTDFQEQRPTGLWHGVNNLLTALAVLALIWSFLCFLWRRKSTAWLGTSLLIFLPISIGVGFVACEVYWIIIDRYLTSDFGFEALTIISVVITLVASVYIEFGDAHGAKLNCGGFPMRTAEPTKTAATSFFQAPSASAPSKTSRKKCSWCGKEYSSCSEATVCVLDGQRVI